MNIHKQELIQFHQKIVQLTTRKEPGGIASSINQIEEIYQLLQQAKTMSVHIELDNGLTSAEKNAMKQSITHLFNGLNQFGLGVMHFLFEYLKKIQNYEKITNQAFNRMVTYGIGQEIDNPRIQNYILKITQQYRMDHEVASTGIKKLTLG